MLADGPTTCQQCGGTLRRILYPTGIIFKGSGFYSTDSRSKADASKGDSAAAAAASSSDGGGAKTGAKASEGGSGPSSGEASSKTPTSESS